MKRTIIIDGDNFNNEDGFRTEINTVLTKELPWFKWYNLDAFNDFLNGGFGVHEYGEPITIMWKNSQKSIKDLGNDTTIKYYERILSECHPTNIPKLNIMLNDAKQGKADTYFDIIIKIIKEHNDIELILL